MSRASRCAAVAAVVAAGLGLAGCSSGPVSKVPGVPGAVVDPPIGHVFPGSELAGFVKQVSLPGGYTVQGADSVDSGPGLVGKRAQFTASADDCDSVLTNFGSPGWGEESYATELGQNASQTDQVVIVVYQFGSDAAASGFYGSVASAWSQCGTFLYSDQGYSARVTLSANAAPEVSGASKSADLRESSLVGGEASRIDFVTALDGDAVVMSVPIGAGSSQSDGVVSVAAREDGQLLGLMNAAQLSYLAPPVQGALPAARGRYGTGN
jgi:hypothetical protein